MLKYKITNLINNKVYIGLTTSNINKRISEYKSTVKADKKSSQRIINAMRKYSFENFQFEILYIASCREELKQKEIEYIALYCSIDPNTGYNISLGGDLVSDETIKKMSKSQKGKIRSNEFKEKVRATLTGHIVSDDTKNKISKSLMGNIPWNKGSEGIMRSNSGSFKKGQASLNKIKVFCPELDAFFESIKEAAKITATNRVSICRVLSGKQKHTKGLTFIRAENKYEL